MSEFSEFKRQVIQFYQEHPTSDYTVEFGEDWRGQGFYCHQITGILFVTFYYNKYNSRRFRYYLTACTDYGRDCILDEIRNELNQSKNKIEKEAIQMTDCVLEDFYDFKKTVAQYYCDTNSEYEITYIPILKTWHEMRNNPYFQFTLCVCFEKNKKVFKCPMTWKMSEFESLVKNLDNYIRKSYRMNFAKKWLR